MNFLIFKIASGNRAFILVTAAILTTMITISCVSHESVEEGSVNSVYFVNGACLIMDQAVDKVVVLAVRNDSDSDLEVNVRPIGGEIGYNSGGSGSRTYFSSSSSGIVRAGYLTRGNNPILHPDEEALITVFLNNWYLATKNFSHRMEVIIDNGLESHAINIQVSQDDIFTDAKQTFTNNKFGRNDPSLNSWVNIDVGSLLGNFVITIPVI